MKVLRLAFDTLFYDIPYGIFLQGKFQVNTFFATPQCSFVFKAIFRYVVFEIQKYSLLIQFSLGLSCLSVCRHVWRVGRASDYDCDDRYSMICKVL